MATKKQKREAALIKRAQFLKDEELRNLELQRRSHDEEELRRAAMREAAQSYNARFENTLKGAADKMPCASMVDGELRQDANVCAAEGCFSMACLTIKKEAQ